MSIVIAQSFMKQLRRLTEREQGMVSNTVLGLQYDPTAARFNLHKVEGDAGWWSCYVNGDLRIILRRNKPQKGEERHMVICWADHHDAAYLWARRHVLQQHPATGAMQLVEIPEVVAPPQAAAAATVADMTKAGRTAKVSAPPCARLEIGEKELLSFGVPELWTKAVLAAATDEELLAIGEHLPPEAAEAVLKIAVGERPDAPAPAVAADDAELPYRREIDKRSWWVVTDDEDLKAALRDSAWGSWCVYLHPSQRAIAERSYASAYRVSGSAGTGKTVVALHHARHILRNEPGSVVLVTTFSDNLADDLAYRMKPLMRPRELERCDTRTFVDFGRETYNKAMPGHPRLLTSGELRDLLGEVCVANRQMLPKGISPEFAVSEFERVVDARGIATWPEYRDALRRGVFRRLSEERRHALWNVFEIVYSRLGEKGLVTANGMFKALAKFYHGNPDRRRLYTHIVVDEAQDLCEMELAFLVAYAGSGVKLFFAGDIGQRIARYSFAWHPFGIDLRGKSRVLKVNYRTTKQIRETADRLMADTTEDADEIVQERKGTISLMSGPKPEFRQFGDVEGEINGVAAWLDEMHDKFNVPSEAVAIFYRSEKEHERAATALARSKYADAATPPKLDIMLGAKGLEYQAVVVMCCDADVIPAPERLAEADVIAGLQEIYDTERNLLYVACTRARDYLLVTSAGIPSELLLDMSSQPSA